MAICKSFRAFGSLISTFIALLVSPAKADMAVGDVTTVDGVSFQLDSFQVCDGTDHSLSRRWQCREKEQIRLGLRALTVTLGATTALCGIAGGPVTVGLDILTSISALAEFSVSELPCDDPEEEALFNRRVCEVLLGQGIACDPDSLNLSRD